MAQGLSVNRIVNVTVNLSPTATPRRTFGVLCIAGDSDVIDGLERLRSYTTLDSVAEDFGMSAPEYRAAELYFSQSPRPKTLMIGRWIAAATAAILRGGVADSDPAHWASITDGAMKIEIDGAEASLTGLDFHAETNMNGVAAVLDTALAAVDASCSWDGSAFVVTSTATGAAASLGFASSPVAGTDISTMTGLTQALAYTPVPGYAAETPAECAAALADMSAEWYGLLFAATAAVTDEQRLAVAAFIEGAGRSRVYGVTVTDARCLSSVYTDDLGSRLKALSRKRTVWQYSANPAAIASLFGRAFSVNFEANRTTITLKFKQEPGIVAENLTETQATVIKGKNGNVFVAYDNDTAILQEGVMANGYFFDEVHGLDWLQDACQNECFNLLYQSKTKIAQTEEGVSRIEARLSSVFEQARANGLIAPGIWNGDGFGQLQPGDYLPQGYYIYHTPIADQAQSEREQRKAPPIQCAVKMAGAVHFVDVTIDVNR